MSTQSDARRGVGAIISRDPEIHSGDVVFAGTRVPVETFIDYVTGGASVEDFLAGYPTVERWQAEALMDLLLAHAEAMTRGDSGPH